MSKYTLDQHESGLFVRRGIPADPYIINEVPTYAALHVATGDVVLDLGANIGAMSYRFLNDGASQVIAVEPFPDNVTVLKKNLQQFEHSRYEVIEAAVVGSKSGNTITLHTPDTNFGMVSRVHHNIHYAPLTGSITVPTVKLYELLVKYKPTVVKCDIEGGEYDFLDDLVTLPSVVTGLAIEWHNFEPFLESGEMAGGYTYADQWLTTEGGFTLVSQTNKLIPGEHSSTLCVYAR